MILHNQHTTLMLLTNERTTKLAIHSLLGRYTINLTDSLVTCKHKRNGSPLRHLACKHTIIQNHWSCTRYLKKEITPFENVSAMALRHFPVRLIHNCFGGYRPPYPPPCRLFGTSSSKNALIQYFNVILPGALQSAHTSLLWTFLDISPSLL